MELVNVGVVRVLNTAEFQELLTLLCRVGAAQVRTYLSGLWRDVMLAIDAHRAVAGSAASNDLSA